MWTLLIVDLDKGVKALLLLQEVEGRGFRGLCLQGQVHKLMAAILL